MECAGCVEIRRADHAGSWYSNETEELAGQLDHWLETAQTQKQPKLRAIISPHAGYSYSGKTAAYAYGAIDSSLYKRVIVLGPSHHEYMNDCGLSKAKQLETPVGNLSADIEFINNLKAQNPKMFSFLPPSVDEAEHSIEMQLPYLARVFSGHLSKVKFVTVMVGSISNDLELQYGKIFAPYLRNPENLFVISSDFCHWGRRFRYTYTEPEKGTNANLLIYQSIKQVDHEGMDLISAIDPTGFHRYLDQKKNTICGRHPIGVLLNAVVECNNMKGSKGSGWDASSASIHFVRYDQSSECQTMNDSSVSYAAAHIVADA